MWGRGPRGNNAACSALTWLSVTHKQIGPFWCWFLGGWVCVCSRAPWVSPADSPVRLGVCPTAATPTDFYRQKFRGSISQPEPWDAQSASLPSCSSQCIHTQMWDHLVLQPLPRPPRSSSCHLAVCPLHPSCPSPPLLPGWRNVSSLTP